MNYTKITASVITELKKITGDQYVLLDAETLRHYGHDETEQLIFLPELVVKPGTTAEISAIMKLVNEQRIPVTPRGAGTGLSGGALPIHAGIVLSMERFKNILQIDERNLQHILVAGYFF